MQNIYGIRRKDMVAKDWNLRFPWAISTLKKLRSVNHHRVFDIGSGEAFLKQEIEQLGYSYHAYDIVSRENVKCWNIEHPFPYDERPDLVTFLEVVEHLNNPWLAVKNIADILPQGGYLILSTPNPSWSDSRASMFRTGVLTMFTQNDLDENHHVFTPWKHILLQLLKDNGFEVCSFENIGSKTSLTVAPFWDIKLPVRLLNRVLKRLIETCDKESVGSIYGVVAKKLPS